VRPACYNRGLIQFYDVSLARIDPEGHVLEVGGVKRLFECVLESSRVHIPLNAIGVETVWGEYKYGLNSSKLFLF